MHSVYRPAPIPDPRIDQQALFAAYHCVLDCGSTHEARSFASKVMSVVDRVCPYDQGRIYCYNENGNICEQQLIDIDPEMVEQYHDYYASTAGGIYGIPLHRNASFMPAIPEIPPYPHRGAHRPFISQFQLSGQGRPLLIIDWEMAPRDEFVKDYVNFIHLTYSTGFAFYDTQDSLRVLFMLDRTCRSPYSEKELTPLSLAIPQLEHLYQNLTVLHKYPQSLPKADYDRLTARESEIVDMLCRGMSTASICAKLGISSATLYTHNARIFKKLGISSRQELIAKMIRSDM